MQQLFIEVNGIPQPVEDITEWAQWMETADRRIQKSFLSWGFVSSVFLGVNHQWKPGEWPILYETMIFDTPLFNGSMKRYDNRRACYDEHFRIAMKAEIITRLYLKRASWRRIKKMAQHYDFDWWLDGEYIRRIPKHLRVKWDVRAARSPMQQEVAKIEAEVAAA